MGRSESRLREIEHVAGWGGGDGEGKPLITPHQSGIKFQLFRGMREDTGNIASDVGLFEVEMDASTGGKFLFCAVTLEILLDFLRVVTNSRSSSRALTPRRRFNRPSYCAASLSSSQHV